LESKNGQFPNINNLPNSFTLENDILSVIPGKIF